MNDLINCMLCNKEFQQITFSHLKKWHNISLADYKLQFPDAKIINSVTHDAISYNAKSNPNIGFKKGHIINSFGKNAMLRPEVKEKHRLICGTKEFRQRVNETVHKTYISNLEKFGKKNPKMSERRKELFRLGILKRPSGKDNPMFGRTGIKHPLFGKIRGEETRKKISVTHKQRIAEGKIKPRCGKDNPMYGKKLSEKHRIALWNGQKKRPTKPELKFIEFLSSYGCWNYVGDGKFFVQFKNGKFKNPDFINKIDRKVVEIYGDYWHRHDDPQDIIDQYNDIGYNCLVIWEHELIERSLRDKFEYFIGYMDPYEDRWY